MSTPLRIVHGSIPAALVLLAACTTDQPAPAASVGADATPSAEPTPAQTEVLATPAPTATPEPTEAGPIERDVNWSIPFTITTPADWETGGDQAPSSATTFQFAIGIDRWVILHRPEADSVEAYADTLRARDGLVVTEAEVTEVGGAAGVVFDFDVTEEAGEVILLREGWGEWTAEANRPTRAWVVAVGGEPVVILTDAPERAFDNWVPVVEEALATLKWFE